MRTTIRLGELVQAFGADRPVACTVNRGGSVGYRLDDKAVIDGVLHQCAISTTAVGTSGAIPESVVTAIDTLRGQKRAHTGREARTIGAQLRATIDKTVAAFDVLAYLAGGDAE